ncbi:MAG: hypothetical protein ACYCZL_05675 [Polaromonas sp.]
MSTTPQPPAPEFDAKAASSRPPPRSPLLHRIRDAIRAWGMFATGLYALDRVLARVSNGKAHVHFYRLELQPVPAQPLLPAHRGRRFEIRELNAGDAAHAMGPRPAAVVAARYAQGSRCLGAFLKDQLVGQLWLQFESYREDEVRCRFCLSPVGKVAWDYDVYVQPSLRASFLFARLWDAAFELLRERQIGWTASRISAFNTGSLASHGRLGARETGRVIFCVAGKVQLMLATTRPFVHFSWSDFAVPELRVAAPRA